MDGGHDVGSVVAVVAAAALAPRFSLPGFIDGGNLRSKTLPLPISNLPTPTAEEL